MITSIADVSCTLIGPPLLKSRPPLQAQVSKTMNIRVPDRVQIRYKMGFVKIDPQESLRRCGGLRGAIDKYFRFSTNRTTCLKIRSCQVIYSQFGLAIHQNDHQARRRFVEWAQNEIAVVPDFHKLILFSDEAHFWLNGYVNKQNCRIWSEANPQVSVETPLHPEKLTVWCALWAGGILLQKR
ncbi:DUF4817 domain-containing protein [Trichonephila clavipes]|nr:DUF4817 domain-containing protein [Trichonephila clavipes]